MDIHEYQAKQLLSANGIKIPKGKIAYTPKEARDVARRISVRGPWVLKAQIHSGARNGGHFLEQRAGQSGGIRIVHTLKDVYSNAEEMLGATLVTSQTGAKGRLVSRIYVEAYNKVGHTFYLGMAIDRTLPAITLLVANTRDDDIVSIVANSPDKILRLPLDLNGPTRAQTSQVAEFLKLQKKSEDSFHNFIRGMFKTFVANDALMIEINPAGVLKNGDIVALDAKISLDEHAAYRHSEYKHFQDDYETNTRELKSLRYGFSYHEYNGNIGCIVNGDGLALAMMNLMRNGADSIACTLNVKGSFDRDKIAAGIKIIAGNPRVEGIVIYILGGFLRCDLIADGIIDAAAEVGMNIPLVVRLEGTNRDEACYALKQAKLPLIMADTMEDAVDKILTAVDMEE